MNTTELDDIIHAPGFVGTFPFDMLPGRPAGNHSIVINTSPSKDPGSHWLALIFKNEKFYFVDSYGRDPHDQTYSRRFKRAIKKYTRGSMVVHNDKWLQSLSSNVCGEYCVYFIQETLRVGFEKMLAVFTDDFTYNDSLVLSYVENM